MSLASWLIGSRPHMPATDLRITANAVTETVTVPAGDYYLWDATASRSLVTAVATAIATHSEIASCTGTLLASRLASLGSATSFAIDSWDFSGAGFFVRDMLGFTGPTTAGIVHVADRQSPYLWSPGKTESPQARLGATGIPVKDTAVAQAGNTVIVATSHNTYLTNRFRWQSVDVERIMTADDTPGEGTYHAFWDAVLSTFFRFKLYRNVDESGTSVVTPLASPLPSQSTLAYTMQPTGQVRFPFTREHEWAEIRNRVNLPVVTRREYA